MMRNIYPGIWIVPIDIISFTNVYFSVFNLSIEDTLGMMLTQINVSL